MSFGFYDSLWFNQSAVIICSMKKADLIIYYAMSLQPMVTSKPIAIYIENYFSHL